MNQKQQDHSISYITLLKVLTALLALTAITVYASQIDMGALNIWVALLIASTKASLVLMFFMHLRYEPRTSYRPRKWHRQDPDYPHRR